jgi:adenylosuccinate synthase
MRINSVSGICLTKLDVLDGLDIIKVCVGYRALSENASSSSAIDIGQFEKLEPIYAELPGWKESTRGAKSLDALPSNAKRYIKFIEEAAEVSVDIISTGPDREETIVLHHPFEGT